LQLEATGTVRDVGGVQPSVSDLRESVAALQLEVDESKASNQASLDFISQALSGTLPSSIQDHVVLSTVNIVNDQLAVVERERTEILSSVFGDGCDSSLYLKRIEHLELEIASLHLENEGLRDQRLIDTLTNLKETVIVDGQVFSAMKQEIDEKTEQIRLLQERLVLVAHTFCVDNESYRDDLQQLTKEHERMRAEMALNRTKELEELKLELENTIAEKTGAFLQLSEAHKILSEHHSLLESDFSAFLLVHESESAALLSEKAKLELDITHLKQTCQEASSNIVEMARAFALKGDRRIDDRETHDLYQFEINSRDERVLWCISKMSSALFEAYENVQNLERETAIFPHKLNLAELKCARLLEGQSHSAANLSRKDTELAAMRQRLKLIMHEMESYSTKCNLLEKKCSDLEEQSAVHKKLFEASMMELEAYVIPSGCVFFSLLLLNFAQVQSERHPPDRLAPTFSQVQACRC
jgi:hypothetical protein